MRTRIGADSARDRAFRVSIRRYLQTTPRAGGFERQAKRSTPPSGRARSRGYELGHCVLASHPPITASRRVFIPLGVLDTGEGGVAASRPGEFESCV